MASKALINKRIHAAKAALRAHAKHAKHKADEISVRDMLADVMHYCASKGIEFAHELSIAEHFYLEEASHDC